MGFQYFPTAQQAVDAAIRVRGENAKIVILGMGGEIAPLSSF